MSLLACRPSKVEDTAPPESVELIDAEAWSELVLSDDPLADHQPDEVSCASGSWYTEYTGIELDTTDCNYFALTQPLPLALTAGEPLSLLAWHQTLLADDPAVGHMALLIDGAVAWEITVDIPADPGIYESTIEAPADAAEGAAVVLHLHNHGYNAWQFDELTALR